MQWSTERDGKNEEETPRRARKLDSKSSLQLGLKPVVGTGSFLDPRQRHQEEFLFSVECLNEDKICTWSFANKKVINAWLINNCVLINR